MSDGPPRLLIVDDEPDVAELIRFVAEEVGFAVRCVHSAHAFRESFRDAPPSAAVLDLVLPMEGGVELLRELGEGGCRVPILLVSGVDSAVLATAARIGESHGLDVRGPLGKPMPVAELDATLRAMLPK